MGSEPGALNGQGLRVEWGGHAGCRGVPHSRDGKAGSAGIHSRASAHAALYGDASDEQAKKHGAALDVVEHPGSRWQLLYQACHVQRATRLGGVAAGTHKMWACRPHWRVAVSQLRSDGVGRARGVMAPHEPTDGCEWCSWEPPEGSAPPESSVKSVSRAKVKLRCENASEVADEVCLDDDADSYPRKVCL
mmetsp:Transcript_48056/g.155060  ORF Transcript_48056/g.155060 Transcript_48056/m.155060 type:complete len:191 (+) Transcript_48056:1962-2534(+)